MRNALLLSLILTTGFTANVTVYMFVGEGCPHCAQAKPYMLSLSEKYAELKLKIYEVYHNRTNAELFHKMAKAYGFSPLGVPTFFIDKQMLVGFSNGKALNPKTGKKVDLEEVIKNCIKQGCENPGIIAGIVDVGNKGVLNQSNTSGENASQKLPPLKSPVQPNPRSKNITNADDKDILTTTVLVITTAAADSVNPCIMAVLTFLIGVLLSHRKDKRKITETGMLYTAVVYTTYLVLGLFLVIGLTQVFRALHTISGFSAAVRTFIAGLVFIAGIINIKDFFWYGRGISFSIPKKYKVKIRKLSKKFVEKGSITAILLIGLIVTLVEFPCSGMMYLGVITYLITQGTPSELVIGYLLLYNIIFVIPLIIITLLARKSAENIEKARLKYRRWFRLILGTALVMLAFFLVTS